MKLSKRLLISVLFITIFVAIAIFNKNTIVNAEETANGYHKEEVISDKFNKEKLDDSWKLNGSTKEHHYNALHCISPISYGYGPIINGAKLTDRTRYEFTINAQTVQSGANISFNIGMPDLQSQQNELTVDCKLQFWGEMITFVVYQNNLTLPANITSKDFLQTPFNLYEEETTIAIIVERETNRLTKVYCEYYRDGVLKYSTQSNTFELNDPRTPYGYSGFFWDCLEMDVTNVKVYNEGDLTFEDDFSSNKITFSSQDPTLGDLHVVGLNETNCYYANVSSIRMDSNKESIVNTYKLEAQENVSTPYEMSFSLKINELNDSSFVGFGFGLKEEDTSFAANNAIGFIRADETDVEVVSIKNGRIDRSNNYLISSLKLNIGEYQTYTVSLDYANNAYLTIGDVTYKFTNIDYNGEFGVGVFDISAPKSSSIDLNEFKLMTNIYKKYSSNDVSNDFNGKKLSDDEFSDEPYLNSQKYLIGPSVSLEEDWATGTTKINFTNATPYSGFGVREKYSEFICEFDIEVLSRQSFSYIGLSFGRESIIDVLVQASTSCKAFLLRSDNGGLSTQQCLYGSGCTFENGSSEQPSSINIFDEDNTKYHMMFVAKNRSLYVYYKNIDAPESEMGILRAYVPNINIDGYVTIVGNNGASFDITNYKMVNLSDECTTESNLTIRETFVSKNSISEKLIVDSLSKVVDGKLEMNNSSVQTVTPYLYEIVRFTAYEVENSFEVKFSEDKKVVFDAINNEIKIYEGEDVTTFDCGNTNLRNIKGKRFEINIIGNTLKIGCKGHYDPEDKLSAELMSYTFNKTLTKGIISFQANGKAIIDDLYVFALDNSMKCETLDYEDDPDNQNIWEVKEGYEDLLLAKQNENTKGCKGSSETTAIGVILLSAFTIGLILYSRYRRKRGNE